MPKPVQITRLLLDTERALLCQLAAHEYAQHTDVSLHEAADALQGAAAAGQLLFIGDSENVQVLLDDRVLVAATREWLVWYTMLLADPFTDEQ